MVISLRRSRIGVFLLLLALIVSATVPFLPHDNNPHYTDPGITSRTSYEFAGMLTAAACKLLPHLSFSLLYFLYSYYKFFFLDHRRAHLLATVPLLLRRKFLKPMKFKSIYV